MICLRCGYCCKFMMVTIVDNPDLGIVDGNIIVHEGKGKPCKHLLGSFPGCYFCSVHNREWYPDTPCYSHTQIEWGNSVCRIGEYVLKKYKEGVVM